MKVVDSHHRRPLCRINLFDEQGSSICYKIEPSITMREILQFYCEHHDGMTVDTTILLHMVHRRCGSARAIGYSMPKYLVSWKIANTKGNKVNLNSTPEKLGLKDLSELGMICQRRLSTDH